MWRRLPASTDPVPSRWRTPVFFGSAALLALTMASSVQAQLIPDPLPPKRDPRLEILAANANGWRNISGDSFNPAQPPAVYTLQSSADLGQWRTAAVLLHAPFLFADPSSSNAATRFYRMALTERTDANDWANQVELPTDPFFQGDDCETTSPLRWVKFAIVLAEPHRVVFQDSQKYRLHYEFAVARLPEFQGLSPEQFNGVALRIEHQRILLGAIVVPPAGTEYGIQFVGLDPYPPEFVAQFFELVKSTVAALPGVRAFYLPTFEQSESAHRNESFYTARGIPIASLDRWSPAKSTLYSPGWALGRLQFIPAAEISAAYADGRLKPTDILLTDGVPAEVPFVAGIVSLVPATPNSHVAILAQSYGVPFVYLSEPGEQARARSLVGEEVMLRTGARLEDGNILLLAVGGSLEPATRAAILALKQPGEINLVPMGIWGGFTASTVNLVPADIRYFGGKASNFGLLRRMIPDYSPEAIAFSFDLWRAFLDQTLPGGQTLRAAIQARLGSYTYPANVLALRADLRAVRDLITGVAGFSSEQRQAILAALMGAGFDSKRNLRFRSSTNVEDAERFTGAGLYDSFSGCLDDDLDSDEQGPSRCDPTEENERGVFRAIQKVYASFYNENAFLERLRFRLTEAEVGMALLVHHSTPDEFEMANGVATLTLQQFGTNVLSQGQLVTQIGAISVANPDRNARPESVEFFASPSFTNVTLRERSALVPLGTNVLAWPDDYLLLAGLMQDVAKGYAQFDTNRARIRLDLEYKKIRPGRLEVKQVREVPLPDSTNRAPAFLLGEPLEFIAYGAPLAVHRAKSRWRLLTTSLALQATNLAQPFYRTAHVDFPGTSAPFSLDGAPSGWPGASHVVSNSPALNAWIVSDGWQIGAGANRREFTLTTELNQTVSAAECPLLTLADARLELQVSYAAPVFATDPFGNISSVDRETVQLFRGQGSTNTTPPVSLTLTTNRLTIVTSQRMVNVYGLAASSTGCLGLIGGKAPYADVGLEGETRIDGLLSKPVTVRNTAAHTVLIHGRQGHERIEELIWEPWLEPDLPADLRSELTSANIGLLYFRSYTFGDHQESIQIVGLDGTVRAWR